VTRRQYKNPPIEEALCEFRFAGGAEWDLAVPARFHERLRAEYPGKPRNQSVLSANVVAGPQAPASLAMVQGLAKLQFPDADAKRLVSLAPDLLSVHVLRPYSGWEDFRRRIKDALDVYRSICAPVSILRLGVRYINRVTPPGGDPLDLRQYFLCEPQPINGLPSQLASFVHRVEHVYEDGIRLFLTYASIEATAAPEFLLDLDVIHEPSSPQSIDGIMDVVNDLHAREGAAFEAIITDKSRGLFDA